MAKDEEVEWRRMRRFDNIIKIANTGIYLYGTAGSSSSSTTLPPPPPT